MSNRWTLIGIVVERGKADGLVDAARKAGASGATILYGRGTATHELLSLFNIQVNALKEIILILADKEHRSDILKAVVDKGRLEDPGTGIAFTVPVDEVVGLAYRTKEKPDK